MSGLKRKLVISLQPFKIGYILDNHCNTIMAVNYTTAGPSAKTDLFLSAAFNAKMVIYPAAVFMPKWLHTST